MVVGGVLATFCVGTAIGQTQKGAIAAWGWNGGGQCNVSAPNRGFIAVAGGAEHSLGLKSDGSIAAWGSNLEGQCDVPAPNEDFVAIAGGGYHSLGLKADGLIVVWGWNLYGQCNVPAPNRDFVAVAAGHGHSLGLKSDGLIAAWGLNNHGQCNVPAPNSGFIAVAAGGFEQDGHSLGLKADGSIVAWGNNAHGQCDVPAPNEDFVAIAGGGYHSLGLKADGSIVVWGDNEYGQWEVPAPNDGFIAIAAGYAHSLGLKADGRIVAWGYNATGQCNVPPPNSSFVAVAAGVFHSLGLKATHGDVNCDGHVDFRDINPFVQLLADPVGWQARYPGCPPLNGDINGDGVVNFQDINPFVSLLASPPTQLELTDAMFTRSGPAYWGEPHGLQSVADGQPRLRCRLRVGNVNMTLLTEQGPAGQTIYPVCTNGTYLFGVEDKTWNLFRTADNHTWEALGVSTGLRNLWAASTGRLIRSTKIGTTVYVHYSDDDGETWTAATGPTGGAMQFLTDDALTDVWSFFEGPGVCFLTEYSAGSVLGRYIYRSLDNGVTWTIAYDAGVGVIRHWHAGGYHVALGRVVAAAGDSFMTGAKTVYSDDLGATWADLTPLHTLDVQPTALLDYGHPTRLLCGSDRFHQVYTLNVDGDASTVRRVEPGVGVGWDRRVVGGHSTSFVFSMLKAGGLYYAACYPLRAPATRVPVAVSPDGVHWIDCGLLPRLGTQFGMAPLFAGVFAGKVHLRVFYASGWRHVVMDPPQVVEVNELLIEPATTNYASADHASGANVVISGDSAHWNFSPSIANDTTQGFEGNACIRLFDTTNHRSFYCRFNNQTGFYTTGDVLRINLWLTGHTDYVRGQYFQKPTSYSLLPGSDDEFWSIWHDYDPAVFWTSIAPAPVSAPDMSGYNTSDKTVALRLYCRKPLVETLDLRADCIHLTKNEPLTEWAPGTLGTAVSRHTESLAWWGIEANADWTLTVPLRLTNATWDLPTDKAALLGNFHLFSVFGIPTDFATLWYDTSQKKITITATDSATGSASYAFPAVDFPRNTPVVIALRRTAGTIRASLLLGGQVIHGSPIPDSATHPLTGTLTITTGDVNGARPMPMWIADNAHMYRTCLSDVELEARMGQ